MAGSRSWFLYEDDTGVKWSVQLDESNAELMGFLPYTDAVLEDSQLSEAGYTVEGTSYTITPCPTNLEMRFVNATSLFIDSVTSQTVKQTKRFIIPTHAKWVQYLTTVGGRIIDNVPIIYNGINQNVTFHITSLIGEIWKNLPTSYDSGQNDGDVTGMIPPP